MNARALPVMVLLLAPWLSAPKCIDADPVLTGMIDAEVAPDGGDDNDGAVRDGSTVNIAMPCAEEGTARIRIRDLQYQIQCGCAETSGKTCTVSKGTRVVWIFSDSEDHDVASANGLFPQSGEKSSGTFSFVFSAPGDYAYLCNIHSVEMNGYTISVR